LLPTDPQWKDLEVIFTDTLRTLMASVWDEAREDLVALGARAVRYWKLSLAGDKDAAEALKSTKRQAALIVGRYVRDAEDTVLNGILNAIEVALEIGLKVLMKVVLP